MKLYSGVLHPISERVFGVSGRARMKYRLSDQKPVDRAFFNLIGTSRTKTAAKKAAKYYRKRGMIVRTVKLKGGKYGTYVY